jgi:hypothetical protein
MMTIFLHQNPGPALAQGLYPSQHDQSVIQTPIRKALPFLIPWDFLFLVAAICVGYRCIYWISVNRRLYSFLQRCR